MAIDQEGSHESRISRNEKDIQDLWTILDDIKNAIAYRLPLWATFLIVALSSTCTGLIVRAFTK